MDEKYVLTERYRVDLWMKLDGEMLLECEEILDVSGISHHQHEVEDSSRCKTIFGGNQRAIR